MISLQLKIYIVDASMTYLPLITQTLRIISVKCISLSSRSKTRRRAALPLHTWILFLFIEGKVNFGFIHLEIKKLNPRQKYTAEIDVLTSFMLTKCDTVMHAQTDETTANDVKLSAKCYGRHVICHLSAQCFKICDVPVNNVPVPLTKQG